jgi:hypothetical protein
MIAVGPVGPARLNRWPQTHPSIGGSVPGWPFPQIELTSFCEPRPMPDRHRHA